MVLGIAVILKRENPNDAVVMSRKSLDRGYCTLDDLPDGATVGTSSVRRIAQLRRNYPHLQIADIVSTHMYIANIRIAHVCKADMRHICCIVKLSYILFSI
jgi:hydroxymethylbilane synthase